MEEEFRIASREAKKAKRNEKVDYSDDEDVGNKGNTLEEQDDFFTTTE